MKCPGRMLALALVLSACTHTVETGQPQVTGATQGQALPEADAIEDLVKPKLGDFDSCYKDEKRRNPKASGKVLFAFSVTRTGRSSDVRLLASTLKSPLMEGCLVGKIEAWQFPPPRDGQDIKVRYPFSFNP